MIKKTGNPDTNSTNMQPDEFCIEKCAILMIKSEKNKNVIGIEEPNQKRI